MELERFKKKKTFRIKTLQESTPGEEKIIRRFHQLRYTAFTLNRILPGVSFLSQLQDVVQKFIREGSIINTLPEIKRAKSPFPFFAIFLLN